MHVLGCHDKRYQSKFVYSRYNSASINQLYIHDLGFLHACLGHPYLLHHERVHLHVCRSYVRYSFVENCSAYAWQFWRIARI